MSTLRGEIYCLLIPLQGTRLLVPRDCVAEVIGLGQLRMAEDAPDWLVGEVGMDGEPLPLVCFEAICGEEPPEIGRRTRAIVLHASGDDETSTGFAILSQGLPQLVRISQEVLALDDEGPKPDSSSPVLCRLRMSNERPLVPDLARIEAMIAA